jgi:hypothetical protein
MEEFLGKYGDIIITSYAVFFVIIVPIAWVSYYKIFPRSSKRCNNCPIKIAKEEDDW